jgi:hypothetical protein
LRKLRFLFAREMYFHSFTIREELHFVEAQTNRE